MPAGVVYPAGQTACFTVNHTSNNNPPAQPGNFSPYKKPPHRYWCGGLFGHKKFSIPLYRFFAPFFKRFVFVFQINAKRLQRAFSTGKGTSL